MKTTYLVDFENVNNEGLIGGKLSKEDSVIVFSTSNAKNISLEVLQFNVSIQAILVPAQKQSVDMHIVSYLGFKLAESKEKTKFVIVSKDTDYDNIIEFWKNRGYENVSRVEKISETETEKEDNKSEPKKSGKRTKNSKSKSKNSRKEEIRNLVDKIDDNVLGNYENEVIDILFEAKSKQEVNNGLTKLYNDTKTAGSIYKQLHPFIKELPGK